MSIASESPGQPFDMGPAKKEIGMKVKGPGLRVRLIRPNGETTFTLEFLTEAEAEARFKRLVDACTIDRWIGARVQRLDTFGEIVHEHIISNRDIARHSGRSG